MKILVTGAAGFIGAALCARLLARGDTVIALDNMSDYYDVALKEARLNNLRAAGGDAFEFHRIDVADRDALTVLFGDERFDGVVHLAAQAGVRYSLENPAAYIDANLVGFGNVLEGCRRGEVAHLVYASSSSVYGNARPPLAESMRVDAPVSLYAASKKANELMAHSYAHLYRLPCTGLRFFTVYGPWGRPDMAFFKFAKLMLAGRPIPVYNHGDLSRDFTYIDDVAEGVLRVIDSPPRTVDVDDTVTAPHKIYNLGNGKPVQLLDYIRALEVALGVKAECEMLPMQDGDVKHTCADTSQLTADFGFTPATTVDDGLAAFADWYRAYYNAPRA